MAEFSYVTLSVLPKDIAKASEILKNNHFTNYTFYIGKAEEPPFDFKIATVEFEEVRWGEITCLSVFAEEGIPYEANTESSYDIHSVVRYCRYTEEGKMIITEIYEDSDQFSLAWLGKALERPDTIKYLTESYEKRLKEITILPWENQEEYSKKYLVNKLLGVEL